MTLRTSEMAITGQETDEKQVEKKENAERARANVMISIQVG